eukprot:Colp12_sorted_trinity150504_noHs@13293
MFNGFEAPYFAFGATFSRTYRCYPMTFMTQKDTTEIDSGGKIFMPSSALEQLTRLNITYPMLFELKNLETGKTSHCGVLEFIAPEGHIYVPTWMMNNLLISAGDLIQLKSATLPLCNFSTFQPQSVDFLDISNPKAVLERALRNFACLTEGDIIAIKYNKKIYELLVVEVKPGKAVTIIECDMQVEFKAPVGYVDPSEEYKRKKAEEEAARKAAEEAALAEAMLSSTPPPLCTRRSPPRACVWMANL